MKLTQALKAHLVEHCGVSEDASDDEYRKAAAVALVNETLTVDQMKELSVTQEEKAAVSISDKLDAVLAKFSELEAKEQQAAEAKTEPAEVKQPAAKGEQKKPADWYEGVIGSMSGDAQKDADSLDVRVKGAWEQYETTKSVATYPEQTRTGRKHPKAGQPIKWFSDTDRPIDNPSQLDKAVAGSFAKYLINSAKMNSRTLGYHQLPSHDKDLLQYAMRSMKWGGTYNGMTIGERPLSPDEMKALVDDGGASGALEAAPIVFDDMVIQAPLLHGELFPLVNVVNIDRGRRVEGVATGTVTGAWGGVDDTAITLFTTTSYITAFDTTIYRWQGAIQIGLDFLSDTPIDFGAHVTAQYGERLLEDLDDVIAAGNGTTQPEGIITKSGTTSVAFGGSTTLGNYESLRFGVSKAEHRPNVAGTAVFCGTETSYQRARAIPVGSSDARRLGGMDYSSYTWMERPYKINESLTNAQIFYAILGRYRMYQRRGLTIRTSTEGDTLIRKNELLVVAMARYGGQLERGACAAKTTTAPA